MVAIGRQDYLLAQSLASSEGGQTKPWIGECLVRGFLSEQRMASRLENGTELLAFEWQASLQCPDTLPDPVVEWTAGLMLRRGPLSTVFPFTPLLRSPPDETVANPG